MNKEFRIKLFEEKEQCNGCAACQAICPSNAITQTTIDGFYYPVIDRNKCIGCNQCLEVCPLKND